MTVQPLRRLIWMAVALAMIASSLAFLEGYRSGVERKPLLTGQTPATLYTHARSDGPLVVVAHGFAGSRQMMEAYALTLARAGYRVVAFDFEGHGRNPVPMQGDVTAIDGTTQRLVEETNRVVAMALSETGWIGPVALIGHSMASDIIVRAALANPRIGPLIAISMFSQAVDAVHPPDLLIISGQWETRLRAEALRAVQLIDPAAGENRTVTGPGSIRRAVVAPYVEHVGVLYSATALRETQAWLDRAYAREPDSKAPASTGLWIALLLAGIVLLGRQLFSAPKPRAAATSPSGRSFWIGLALPAIAAPLIAVRVDTDILPVLVADYLALHLLIYGVLQGLVLSAAGFRLARLHLAPAALLVLFCLCVFGLALDRYVASFIPTGTRLLVFAGVLPGALAFMLCDTLMGTGAAIWRRLVLRIGFLTSLIIAVMLDPERLMFVLLILPVILLYFAVFATIARPVTLRAGTSTAGLALGIVLAWSIAAAFPVFAP